MAANNDANIVTAEEYAIIFGHAVPEPEGYDGIYPSKEFPNYRPAPFPTSKLSELPAEYGMDISKIKLIDMRNMTDKTWDTVKYIKLESSDGFTFFIDIHACVRFSHHLRSILCSQAVIDYEMNPRSQHSSDATKLLVSDANKCKDDDFSGNILKDDVCNTSQSKQIVTCSSSSTFESDDDINIDSDLQNSSYDTDYKTSFEDDIESKIHLLQNELEVDIPAILLFHICRYMMWRRLWDHVIHVAARPFDKPIDVSQNIKDNLNVAIADFGL